MPDSPDSPDSSYSPDSLNFLDSSGPSDSLDYLDSPDSVFAVFAKTDIGQQEMQSRSLGLTPLVRRILVLADGKKSVGELAAFLPNADAIPGVLRQLISTGCLQAQAASKAIGKSLTRSADPVVPQTAPAGGTAGLVPAAQRTAKENEMARHFMINSINGIIGQQMRISLITDIAGAHSTDALRTVYLAWEASMADHGTGKKRLPELKEKLFKVL